jgi:hypothetical protein
MPDWFYRTMSRPLLFRLPATTARGLALGMMGRLARLPLGSAIIDFLGHMGADSRLRCEHLGIVFPSPIGLGPALDADAVALPALARFGFGFLDVGPVTLEPWPDAPPSERGEDRSDLAVRTLSECRVRLPRTAADRGIASRTASPGPACRRTQVHARCSG